MGIFNRLFQALTGSGRNTTGVNSGVVEGSGQSVGEDAAPETVLERLNVISIKLIKAPENTVSWQSNKGGKLPYQSSNRRGRLLIGPITNAQTFVRNLQGVIRRHNILQNALGVGINVAGKFQSVERNLRSAIRNGKIDKMNRLINEIDSGTRSKDRKLKGVFADIIRGKFQP